MLISYGGNDTLSGGAGSDTFVFENGFGHDVITDFDTTLQAEVIDLSAITEITDFNDLIASHIRQQGSDAVISVGQENSITILNTNLSSLNADDFIFS